MVLLLDRGSALLAGKRRAALFSTVSVLFSSASFIRLPLFALLDGVRHRRAPRTAFLRIMAVLVPMAVYYFLFAHHHPAEGRMEQFWSKGFLFSGQGNPVTFVVHRLLGVIHTGYFSAAFQLLWIFYLIGLYRYIKTRDYAALAATQLPVVAHLAFSALRLYPFDGGRLTLYLLVPFVYCAADGLRIAIAALAHWHVPVIRHDAGSSFEVATILAVAGNALGYALLAPKREDLRSVLAELRREPDWYKRSVPLHFLPSSGKQLDYYAAQSRAAGEPLLEGYRKISRDQGWEPFLRDVLTYRRVVLVFSHSGRFFRRETGRRGYLPRATGSSPSFTLRRSTESASVGSFGRTGPVCSRSSMRFQRHEATELPGCWPRPASAAMFRAFVRVRPTHAGRGLHRERQSGCFVVP